VGLATTAPPPVGKVSVKGDIYTIKRDGGAPAMTDENSVMEFKKNYYLCTTFFNLKP
jgi:hypothetical protein